MMLFQRGVPGGASRQNCCMGLDSAKLPRAVHVHQNLDRFQHLMSRVTRLRAHLRPHAVAALLAASDGRIQFVGGVVRLQMGGRLG